MNGFYKATKQITSNNPIEKRNRMLKKIKADRERSQEIKQQDIFYITKYANKFKIDTKNLINWALIKFGHVQDQKKRPYLDKLSKKD